MPIKITRQEIEANSRRARLRGMVADGLTLLLIAACILLFAYAATGCKAAHAQDASLSDDTPDSVTFGGAWQIGVGKMAWSEMCRGSSFDHERVSAERRKDGGIYYRLQVVCSKAPKPTGFRQSARDGWAESTPLWPQAGRMLHHALCVNGRMEPPTTNSRVYADGKVEYLLTAHCFPKKKSAIQIPEEVR